MHHACIDAGAGAAMAQLIYDASPSPREVDAPPPRKASQKDDERDFVSALVASSLEFWTLGEKDRLSASVEVPRTGRSDLASVLVESAIQGLQQRNRFLAGLPQVLKMANELGNKLMSTISLDDLSKLIAPPTIINGSISSERGYAAVTLPMSRMKAIAAKSGTKLNDVVLAVASGVLRGHLLEQGALPQKSLTAFVPVSTREAGDTSASNKVMGMICRLNTEIEDPRLRLEAIVADSAKSKELTSPFRQLALWWRIRSYWAHPWESNYSRSYTVARTCRTYFLRRSMSPSRTYPGRRWRYMPMEPSCCTPTLYRSLPMGWD
jgi:diacylglycerol O-acyltransferase / wax synthase